MNNLSCILKAFLLLTVSHTSSYAQVNGRLNFKNAHHKPLDAYSFVYQPSKKIAYPQEVSALILYKDNDQFHKKIINVTKVNDNYEFSFNPPDSTSVLLIGIVDQRQNLAKYSPLLATRRTVIDNNENGFVFYLKNNTKKEKAYAKLELIDLLRNKAEYFLGVRTEDTTILKLYAQAYQLYPSLQTQNHYVDYLELLHNGKVPTAKPRLMSFAERIQIDSVNESTLKVASRIYKTLNLTEKHNNAESAILRKFPNGQTAKDVFLDNFYSSRYDSDQSVLLVMDSFVSRFKDSSNESADIFYNKVASLLMQRQAWDQLGHYENKIKDKSTLQYIYDYWARQLSQGNPDSITDKLLLAKKLSSRAIYFAEQRLSQSKIKNEDQDQAQGEYNRNITTYAFILSQQKNYDSAFHYQDIIYQQEDALNPLGIERYASYAEKAKGPAFARGIIEQQFVKGNITDQLQKQLVSIYKQLNLSEDEASQLLTNSNVVFKKKNESLIKAKFGGLRAANFSLRNSQNVEVSLSSLIGKVVILDFWANWCSPCKAAFPVMQGLVNKYKNDSGIVFLFIDVWERQDPKTNQQTTVAFLNKNKYTFEVLYDVKDEVVAKYKVEAIPQKFVIDKNGDMLYMGDDSGVSQSDDEIFKELSFFIDQAKAVRQIK